MDRPSESTVFVTESPKCIRCTQAPTDEAGIKPATVIFAPYEEV
jgi:hypothetical protein